MEYKLDAEIGRKIVGNNQTTSVRIDKNGKAPYTVTTLYYSCDNNIFQSSESSVQVVSASNYNACIGHYKPNFCELDIIAKKDKLKLNVDFVPLTKITEELKSLPMSTKLKSSKTGFRKKIYHRNYADEPNEVLCLANVLKDDVTAFQPGLINRNQNQEPTPSNGEYQGRVLVDEMCQTKKKKRSKSRRRKQESDQHPVEEAPCCSKKKDNIEKVQSQETCQSPQLQFADLGTAKMMYFAELPNTSAFTEKLKVESTKEEKKKKRKKSKSSKERRSSSAKDEVKSSPAKDETKSSRLKETSLKNEAKPSQLKVEAKASPIKIEPKLSNLKVAVFINKVENDFPPLSSPGSLTTVHSQAFKKDSNISFTSIEIPKSTNTDLRRRHNSPTTDGTFLDDAVRKYKTDTTVYKGKHRKKHRTSPKLSSDEENAKNIKKEDQPEAEVQIIYRVDQDKSRSHKDEKKHKKKREHSPKKDKIKVSSKKEDDKTAQHKKRSKSDLVEQTTKNDDKPNEVLDLYQSDKPLKSESCTMIAMEEFLNSNEDKKRKSRKSSSPNKKKGEENKQKPPVEDSPQLEDGKDRKTKQRSKSRAAEEKHNRKRYKSKAPPPNEKESEDLTKKLSRKSTSDLSKKDGQNFDGHKSVEGVQKDKSKRSSSKKHKEDAEIKDAEKLPHPVLIPAKDKRKRSKSYAPKKEKDPSIRVERPVVSSRSHIFETKQCNSENCSSKRHPRSKSKISTAQNQIASIKKEMSSTDKFYEELRKISTIQQIEESRKRFKVVSRTIRSKLSDGSSTQSTEHSYINKKLTGSRRFKTYICSEREKEEILNLPICNKDLGGGKTMIEKHGENIEEYTIEIEEDESTKNIKHGYQTSEMEEGYVKEERCKRKKKIRRTVSRKEVAFAHLNVTPLMDLYKRPSRSTFLRRTLLPEKKPIDFLKFTDSRKEASVNLDQISEDTDLSTARLDAKRLNQFTMILGEKILEICTKAIGEDGKIIEGFTVSGTEPPKRFKSNDLRKDRLIAMAKVSKLHYTYHTPIEIIDGVMQAESVPSLPQIKFHADNNAEEVIEAKKSAVVMTDLKEEPIPCNYKQNSPMKTPILLKTKRKFIFAARRKSSKSIVKKESPTSKTIPLTNTQTSTESHSTSDTFTETQDKIPEDTESILRQSKVTQKQENKTTSRINSAVKLMESSLQIIKEESQSTDSSSRFSNRKTIKDLKQCESEIKETQTDICVEDIDKIKEVITYLYNSIDSKKESVSTVAESEVAIQKDSSDLKDNATKQDSSTESSSYQEQFKNFVRNVTPKFCNLRKNLKQENSSKTTISITTNKEPPTLSKIPTLTRRRSLSASTPRTSEMDATIISDSLSSTDRSSSSSSNDKNNNLNKPAKNQKNLIRRRSSSADVLTSGYFEKYTTTKALIEQQRQKRADSVEANNGTPQQPEFKSSTSVSDFSSVVVSLKEDGVTPDRSKETEIAVKNSDEKYVQCILVADIVKEYIDKNIGTRTEDEKEVETPKISPKHSNKSLIGKVKSSLSLEKVSLKAPSRDKIYEDKSLQTSVLKEEIKEDSSNNCRINVLYADVPYKTSNSKKNMLDELLNRMSSHSFMSPRKSPTNINKKKDDSDSIEKFRKFERLRRVFSGKQENQLLRNSGIFSYHMSEKHKKCHNKKGPEMDYMNLVKLERHLEQVLGLYPLIFKAIRSQIDEPTMRKLDKRLKMESPELFTSYDTLATTIDTISEYRQLDSYEKYPSFSESNLNRFNRYCESLNLPGQEHQLQQFIESQNVLCHSLKKQIHEKKKNLENPDDKHAKIKIKINRCTTHHPKMDSTSTCSKNSQNKRAKSGKKGFKPKTKKKNAAKMKDISALSLFSQNGFCSDSSSSYRGDNWSIRSPLYSITTPSLNVGRSQSSTSVMQNKPTQTKLTKSRSVIEMSSIRKINRRLAMKHLIEFGACAKNPANKQNVLVVSVNSSCTVFATPSKFLSKVEKHLEQQKSDDKHDRHLNNILEHKISKKQVDEQSFHSLFFSDNKMKTPPRSERATHMPFYIHNERKEQTDEEFLDSIDAKPPSSLAKDTIAKAEEEDLGNFSADSLDSNEPKQQRCCLGCVESKREIVAPQRYFVYSSTVNYNRNSPKFEKKNENIQTRQMHHNQAVQATANQSSNSAEDTSKTLLSESGYESTKSKRTASIRNFFKKGGSLLDIFRNSSKNKIPKIDNTNVTNFSHLWLKKIEQIPKNSTESIDITEDGYKSRRDSPCRSDNTVYWSIIKNDTTSRKDRTTTTFSEIAGSSRGSPRDKTKSPRRNKDTHSPKDKTCPCSDPATSYQRQMDECHAYAEKVLLESQLRREGYYKQYQDFKELPLELLIGKRIPNKSKLSQEVSVMTKPKSKPISTQSRKHAKGKGVDATTLDGLKQQNASIAVDMADSRSDIVVLRSDSPVKIVDETIEIKADKKDIRQNSMESIPEETQPLRSDIIVYRGESRVRMADKVIQMQKPTAVPENTSSEITSKPSLKPDSRNFGNILVRTSKSFHDFLLRGKKDAATNAHISKKNNKVEKPAEAKPETLIDSKPIITRFSRDTNSPSPKQKHRSKSPPTDPTLRGCTCDGRAKLPPKPQKAPKEERAKLKTPSPAKLPPPPVPKVEEVPLKIVETIEAPLEKVSSESVEFVSDNFFVRLLVQDIVDQAVNLSDKKQQPTGLPLQSTVQLPPMDEIEKQTPVGTGREEAKDEDPEICRKSSEDFRKGLTDKEVFDKLLNSFEKEDEIATRLSKDEEFFKDQIKTIKKESDESIEEERTTGADPNEVIYSEDPLGDKHRSTHFWEEKMKSMKAREENPVKEDDIGTCFSRGFRPDNIALSGDACFSLNKQDRVKFSKGMLTNDESIIDFSERETPLDFLLALGFMVDEASNALKDEDIRSRLLAAITEARVWINKITTTQGTLLYLVAYKSRPKTMRYFLQLVEAIINKRINNAIKLDGFLRVLEKVEEGEIQMINILGADKFEDEENEEKIVKKQLRQLFITVYKIAEKESLMKGKQLSQQAIVLLRILAAKYRAGLHPHLELIARYIGQELLNTETQLEAAMIFLSRLDTAEVKLKEFEAYCDIKCDRRKKKTNRMETALERSTSLPDQVTSERPLLPEEDIELDEEFSKIIQQNSASKDVNDRNPIKKSSLSTKIGKS